MDRGLESDRTLFRRDEFNGNATRLEDLDGVEVAGGDVDLPLLEKRCKGAWIGGDRRQAGF